MVKDEIELSEAYIGKCVNELVLLARILNSLYCTLYTSYVRREQGLGAVR